MSTEPSRKYEPPSTCENPEADCYREPTNWVWRSEDFTAPDPKFEGYLCDQCLAAIKIGTRFSATDMDYRPS